MICKPNKLFPDMFIEKIMYHILTCNWKIDAR